METWLVPGLELKKYKMNLQYLVTPEDKEVLKKGKKQRERHVKRIHPSPEGFPLAKLGAISITQ